MCMNCMGFPGICIFLSFLSYPLTVVQPCDKFGRRLPRNLHFILHPSLFERHGRGRSKREGGGVRYENDTYSGFKVVCQLKNVVEFCEFGQC